VSTFDASTPDQHDHPPQAANTPAYTSTTLPGGYGYDNDAPDPAPGIHYADLPTAEPVGRSTLDELRAAAAEEDTREPITVVNPRNTIRLTLRTDLEQHDLQRWQNKALPLDQRQKLARKGGQPNLSKLDTVIMFASAIADTTTLVEVRSRATNDWQPVVNEHGGEPLTFADTALRQVLGGVDAISAVKGAFNRSEPALLDAGMRLLDASGFGDDDVAEVGDGQDPTVAAG